jgi:hypothetical protein
MEWKAMQRLGIHGLRWRDTDMTAGTTIEALRV